LSVIRVGDDFGNDIGTINETLAWLKIGIDEDDVGFRPIIPVNSRERNIAKFDARALN
jgi:hypothetical protein